MGAEQFSIVACHTKCLQLAFLSPKSYKIPIKILCRIDWTETSRNGNCSTHKEAHFDGQKERGRWTSWQSKTNNKNKLPEGKRNREKTSEKKIQKETKRINLRDAMHSNRYRQIVLHNWPMVSGINDNDNIYGECILRYAFHHPCCICS